MSTWRCLATTQPRQLGLCCHARWPSHSIPTWLAKSWVAPPFSVRAMSSTSTEDRPHAAKRRRLANQSNTTLLSASADQLAHPCPAQHVALHATPWSSVPRSRGLAVIAAAGTSSSSSHSTSSTSKGRIKPSSAIASPISAQKTGKQPQQAPSEPPKNELWLIVGLGNPGKNYERTRHNVGFMVIDELARVAGIDCRKLEKSAAVGKGEIDGRPVLLVKPVTFMNNSGESVSALSRFYRVPPSRILVISDDLDLPTAAVRLRGKGGHGGHNGLRSIIERLGGTHEFPRIKIGIGRPVGELPVPSYVLQDFSKKEQAEIDMAVQESISIVRSILGLGMEKALSGVRF